MARAGEEHTVRQALWGPACVKGRSVEVHLPEMGRRGSREADSFVWTRTTFLCAL